VGLTHADLDIGDAEAVDRAVREVGPDLIINTAAYTAVDKAEAEPHQAARANAAGAENLARVAAQIRARLIHLSTDYVFDGAASRPYGPDSTANPLSVYGRTKLAGEAAVKMHLPQTSTIIRTSWVYAAEGRNFVRTMLRFMATQESVRVVGDQIGSPTAASSLAGVIWTVAVSPRIAGVYHWADAGVASWYDFAVAIAEEAAAAGLSRTGVRVEPIATEDYPTAAPRPRYSVLDTRLLRAISGLQAQHWRVNLRAVLREMKHA
jgi:dTDP-4-dehydrorhamnose reductase